jgi:hypothetical protein
MIQFLNIKFKKNQISRTKIIFWMLHLQVTKKIQESTE